MSLIEAHEKLSDQDFVDRFQREALNEIPFTHRAHLRLAWIYIHQFGEEKTMQILSQQLKRYTRSAGAGDKYNQTVTIAAIKAVRHFAMRSSSRSFNSFLMEFPSLETDFKRLLSNHYSFDIFNDPKAKATFIEPDLIPFD